MRCTFKTVFYVNGSKERNGIVPIMGRVTINGTIAQFSCKQSVTKAIWDAKGNRAIAHRIKTAGIKRKITNDQVRVIRTMLSGTHEDMMNIAANGQLDDWCNDSLKWLQDTFGKENVVSVVLHMDEHTLHLHASIVPIVIGERRKARSKPTEEGKRTYRKKANAVRLFADDVLNRDKMIGYHDSYAEAMGKYGLKRGVRGSDARHTTTAQYYRNIKRETERLQNCMKLLQSDIEEAQRLLQQTKSEISTEKTTGC